MKADFEKVLMVHVALNAVYHTEEEMEDADHQPSDMFLSMWTIFLNTVSWTDEEFWDEWEKQDSSSEEDPLDQEDESINDLDTSSFSGYKKDGKPTLN